MTKRAINELIGNSLIHGLREMNAVPVDVLRRVGARGGVGGPTGGEDLEVQVAGAGAAAGSEGLGDAVAFGGGED